jgi:hypothetical protein
MADNNARAARDRTCQEHRGQDQKDETSYGRPSARSSEIKLIILMELIIEKSLF